MKDLSYEEAAGKLPWSEEGLELLFTIKKQIEDHRKATSAIPKRPTMLKYISEDKENYFIQVLPKVKHNNSYAL